MNWAEKIIKFFASLKLAAFTILGVGIISAVGTIVEAKYNDADVANKLVYQSGWMYFILGLLIIQLIAVMIDRWPWKQHHTGFVLAHIGIIILLGGSLVTQRYGIDGSMAFGIGESRNIVLVKDRDLIVFASLDGQEMRTIYDQPADFLRNPPSEKDPFIINLGKDEMKIIAHEQFAFRESEITATEDQADMPAVRFQLENPNVNMTEWLRLERGRNRNDLDLGPAKVVFSKDVLPPSGRNEILLIVRPGQPDLDYVIYNKDNSLRKKGRVSQSDTIETGWMGLKFRLLRYLPHAAEKVSYRPLGYFTPVTTSAAKFLFNGKEHWVALNQPLRLFMDDRAYIIVYGNRQIPLGFALQLKEFRMDKYQGTSRAATYESDVIVPGGTQTTISMNEPLVHSGFTFYQSSFEQDETGKPTVSVLSVNRDPGRWIKYLGSMLIVLGSVILFYFKRVKWIKRNAMKKLIALFFVLMSVSAFADVGGPLEGLPIQDAGRVKPFGTFAQESLQLIYGKKTYEKKSATEIVFTWLLIPDHWMDQPVIEIRHHGVKEALKIDSPNKYFSAQSLFTNPRITLIFQELQNHRARQEKLNPYFQAVSRLENQLALFQAIRGGNALRFVPDASSDTWKAVPQLDGDMREAFQAVGKGFVDSIANTPNGGTPVPSEEFKAAVDTFIAKARAISPEKYADANKIKFEIHLNHFHPFKWAWIAYLLGFLCMVAVYAYGSRKAEIASWVFLLLGFALHTYGMALRSYLSGRPPVSNMYETVVWVPWGVLAFAMILERVQKNKIVLGCAAVVSVFCLILTDLAPTILDKSLHPLEPVLRSTFWLSTHVLIITISYAAFFLAFALGDLCLFWYLKDEQKYAKHIATASQSIYRSIQIGVVLLAFGIILGGIWADYSWGRFWGWDPKETWALIALLGYLALLHGKLIGMVRNFGMAAGAVVAFLLVIMAWYGVNMVLGAGLHTYGFGAGGIVEVGIFCVLHLLFVAYVSAARYPSSKI